MALDRYDVEAMIRDAPELSELRRRCDRLEDELGELRSALGAERVDRQDADESIQRVLDARTEGMV